MANSGAALAAWLAGEYQAALFWNDGCEAGYALFRFDPEFVYLRQFFVCPGTDGAGVGRAAIAWLGNTPAVECRECGSKFWWVIRRESRSWRKPWGSGTTCTTMEWPELPMSAEQNKALVRRYYEKMLKRLGISARGRRVNRRRNLFPWVTGDSRSGSLGVHGLRRAETVRHAFPDFPRHNLVEELVAEDAAVSWLGGLTRVLTRANSSASNQPENESELRWGPRFFRIAVGAALSKRWVLGDAHGAAPSTDRRGDATDASRP